jgi:PAS domain S-box-containing protein
MVSDGERDTPISPKGARLRHFFDTINAPALALNPEGRVLLASERFAAMVKLPREQLEGVAFEQFIAPQERSRFQRLLAQSEAVRGSAGEVVLRRNDDESLFAHIALRRLRRPFPDVILLLCLDTTHHHHVADRLRRERAELEARVQERTAELAEANNALQEANRALAAQKALLESVLDQSPDPLVVVDVRRRILLANSAARQLGDTDPSGASLDVAQGPLGRLSEADGRPIGPDEASLVKALHGEACLGREVHVAQPNGAARTFLVSTMPLLDDQRRIVGAVSTSTEVTHLRKTEGKAPPAFEDKDILLREMRHRFRNNLAILASLLGLQSDSVTSEEARAALEESRQRVYSMARLQDQLHHGGSAEPVRMDIYLDVLMGTLTQAYGRPGIEVSVNAQGVILDAGRADSVGLIVNELVTNAFKHAFPKGRAGEILVAMEDDGEDYRLRVWDTGVGFLSDGDLEQRSSFGLRLVNLLVRRLHGSLSIETAAGSQVIIRFPAHRKE